MQITTELGAGFAQILTNVPINLILDSDIELVGVWVKSQLAHHCWDLSLGTWFPSVCKVTIPLIGERLRGWWKLSAEVQIIQEVFGEDNKFRKGPYRLRFLLIERAL